MFSFKGIGLVSVAVFGLLIASVGFLHLINFNYKVDYDIVGNVDSSSLVNKSGNATDIKTIRIKNDFITPRKVFIPQIVTCLKDDDSVKPTIKLLTTVEVNKLSIGPGKEVWVYPFSKINVNYSVKGDWYDYVFQYLDYDSLELVTTTVPVESKSCEDILSPDLVETITVSDASCFGCVSSKGGFDLSVVDFIVNDDQVSEESFIHFVPIIKNIGDMASGQFEVIYYLNGKHSNSFTIGNLNPGEIVNNFIAGSGIQGNFGVNEDREMELKIMLVAKGGQDLNPANNGYNWRFQYTTKRLPNHSCVYTDNNQGSDDFYTATSIKYNDRVFADFCLDENNLLEYNCDLHPVYNGDAGLDVFLYKCPMGCVSGACKK